MRLNDEPLYGDGATGPDVNRDWNGLGVLGPDRCVAAMAGAELCEVDGELPNGIRASAFVTQKDGFGSVSEDGRWYIKVKGQNANARGRYRLSVEMDRKYILCTDDIAEPNNMSGAAFDLMAVDELTQARLGGGREIRPNQPVSLPALNLCDELTFGSPTGPAVDRVDTSRKPQSRRRPARILVRTEDDNQIERRTI